MNDQIRQYIVKHFEPPIDSIVRNCLTLRKILLEKSDSEALEDLDRILSGSTLLQEKLVRLPDEELRAVTAGDHHTIANIRHDLRTPLNAILGYTKILAHAEEHLDNFPEHHHYSAILEAATVLNKEIDLLGQKMVNALPPPVSNLNANPEISNQLRRISQHSDANKLSGRILVVDDVEQNRLLLQRQLTPDGHTISVADSGAVALGMIQQQEFDLILLDIMMPDLNGLELLEILKSSEQHQQIPIIVISGLGDMDAVAPCISAGAEDYLTKPFNPVLLRARISSSLQKKKWGDKERGYIAQIEGEKKRSEAILQSILPSTILKRLKLSNEPIADRYDDVTVMFADIVGFTSATESMTPEEVLEWLDRLFSEFDQLAEEHGVEKIKTIGDAYMVACGAPLPQSDHADRILDFAISLLNLTNSMAGTKNPVVLRIGIHSGPVVAGLLGRHRYVYDLWGETVNVASRIESNGTANRICVSARVADQSNARFNFTSRGKIMLKGVGLTEILTLKTNRGAS